MNVAPAWLARGRRVLARWAGPVAIAAGVALALLPVRFSKPPNPQWEALFAYMRDNGVQDVWQGGFNGARSARLYLEFGAWPRPTRENAGELIAAPPAGAVIAYHARDGLRPGRSERTLFTRGDLTLTRLESPPWEPTAVSDPGD